MPDTYDPYAGGTLPSTPYTFAHNNSQYLSRANKNKSDEVYRGLGGSQANTLGTFGLPAEKVGLNNLYQMLLGQGRMDPRIMAQQQNAISRGTTANQTSAQGMLAQKGFGQSGLGAALQGAIGQAGVNQQADLRYKNEADSYARNQQNLGLLQQLVGQPSTDYAAIGAGQYGQKQQQQAQQQAGWLSLIGSLVGGLI